MKEHKRRWTAETKLSLIKEVQTSGSVIETCKKFGVDPCYVLQDERELYKVASKKGGRLLRKS